MNSFTVTEPKIGERTDFRIQGTIDGGAIVAGDCFRVVWVEPYEKALEAFEECGDDPNGAGGFSCTAADFFAPFPTGYQYNLISSSAGSAVTVRRESGYELRLELTGDSTDDFDF